MSDPLKSYPIVSLQIENMRHVVKTAITEHQAQVDADVQKALDAACSPENLSRVIHEATISTVSQVIEEEVKAFFQYGDGRKAIAAAVRESLLKRDLTSSEGPTRREVSCPGRD